MADGISPLFLILAGLIGLFIGLLAANLFSGRDARSKKKDEEIEKLTGEGFAEGANLWFSPAGKKVIVEMDGEYYKDVKALSLDQKTRVVRLLELFKSWAGENMRTPAEILAEPEKIKGQVPIEPVKVEPAAATVRIEPKLPLTPEIIAKKSDARDEDIKKDEESTTANKSIVEQISQIMAELMVGTPLKERGIKLIENQQHGVDVWVGLEKFSGIDSVPYPEIQQLIRSAVGRWEKETEERRKVQTAQ